MSKTLYVSDLDGTLLKKDETLSPFTVDTINALVERGMIFSYATARSLVTARRVTAGLTTNLPVVIYNGSFVVESATGKRLISGAFAPDDAREILDDLMSREIYPIVYAFVDGVEKFSYVEDKQSCGARWFNGTRRGDVRERPLTDSAGLYDGEIFHLTCIDEPERLLPMYQAYCHRFECIYHKDIYSGEQWLELQPRGATKAEAIGQLKRLLECDRVVCFGDGKNDVSMFEMADECYAVANADEELKAMATAVIESNEQDGVARFLMKHWKKQKEMT